MTRLSWVNSSSDMDSSVRAWMELEIMFLSDTWSAISSCVSSLERSAWRRSVRSESEVIGLGVGFPTSVVEEWSGLPSISSSQSESRSSSEDKSVSRSAIVVPSLPSLFPSCSSVNAGFKKSYSPSGCVLRFLSWVVESVTFMASAPDWPGPRTTFVLLRVLACSVVVDGVVVSEEEGAISGSGYNSPFRRVRVRVLR